MFSFRLDRKSLLQRTRRPKSSWMRRQKARRKRPGREAKNIQKREVPGKMMVIYKINGDRNKYVRHKGKLITIKDYEKLMKKEEISNLST